MTNFSLKLIKSSPNQPVNWLFLPGGPGLGAETLLPLIKKLDLDGKCWLADYPFNSDINQIYDYNQWTNDLKNLAKSLENVVIVAHSFGGMLVLSTPYLEQEIIGLVLLNTAPTSAWIQEVPKYAALYQLPDTSDLQKKYMQHPTNELFKQLTIACAPFFFTKKSMEEGLKLLKSLPYNHRPYDWALKEFHPSYHYQWIPEHIPTLIIGGEMDPLTPLHLFQDEPAFQRTNIEIYMIKEAGHFAWLDDIETFKKLFSNFQNRITLKSNYSVDKITFKNPSKADFQLIYDWFIKLHVQKWFDHPETGKTIKDLKNYLEGKEHLFTPWLACHEKKPFAYLMTSVVTEEEMKSGSIYGKWREKTGETYTLDIFIGEEAFIGKGLAPKLIKKFIETQFPHTAAFLIDPEIKNTHAIHVYEKSGFTKVDEFAPDEGQFSNVKHVMMKYKRPN